MKTNLIIDGNYVLHRNLNILTKTNTLYGDLEESLHNVIRRMVNIYPFNKVLVVSDSKSASWRKSIYPEYKGTRSKSDEIDWEFVYNTYDQFKTTLADNHRYRVYESQRVEGDDWITHLVKQSNNAGISTIIAASDGDLHQLLEYRTVPSAYINIQWRDIAWQEKVFLPSGYKFFIDAIRQANNDIFSPNQNSDFLSLISEWQKNTPVEEVDFEEKVFVKLVHGDTGDNIKAVCQKATANGSKMRGIGEAGAKKIYASFKQEYNERIDFHSDKWIRDVAPHVLLYKKVDDDIESRESVMTKLHLNRRLVILHERYLPTDIKSILESQTF